MRTTATVCRHSSTAGAALRRRCWCAAARSKTSSSPSPAARWRTDVLATGSVRVFERQVRVYRKLWRGSLLSHFAMPLLFLGAMGLGLGPIVDARTRAVGGVGYLAFIAP